MTHTFQVFPNLKYAKLHGSHCENSLVSLNMATGLSRRFRFLTVIFRSFWVWVIALVVGWLMVDSSMYVGSIFFDAMCDSGRLDQALSWSKYGQYLVGPVGAILALVFVVGMFVYGIRFARWIQKPSPTTPEQAAETSSDEAHPHSEPAESAKASRGRKTLVATLVGVLAVLSLVIAFDPTHFVWGLLTGQHFFRARPTSYWRKVFRQQGKDGKIGPEQQDEFRVLSNNAEGVLKQCSRDSHPIVRRVAVQLVGVSLFHRGAGILLEALKDEDADVRISALISLGNLGSEGSLAVQEVETLARLSPIATKHDEYIRELARYALWSISPKRARTILEWKKIVRQDLNCIIAFPGTPKIETNPPKVIGPHIDRVIAFDMFAIKAASVALFVIDLNPNAPILEAGLAQRYDQLIDAMLTYFYCPN